MRGNQRRLLREARAAEGLDLEPDGEPPCDAETRARVRAAVEALDDRSRAIVRMRYFEDLLPCEIAERMRLPVETVRTRLKRGLARIRRALMRRGG